jgi:hypothetical protein
MSDLLYVKPSLQTPISARIHRHLEKEAANWKSSVSQINELNKTVNAIKEFVKSEKEREGAKLNLQRYLELDRLTKIAASLENEI